jgi:hypothetical protein
MESVSTTGFSTDNKSMLDLLSYPSHITTQHPHEHPQFREPQSKHGNVGGFTIDVADEALDVCVGMSGKL